MRLFFAILVSGLALGAAEPQTETQKTAARKPAAKPVRVAQPLTIPEGAVAGADGDYHFTDAQGKKWLYRKTPFGVAKREDTGAPALISPALISPATISPATISPATISRSGAPAAAAGSAGLKAREDGDVVHFEKAGPFGPWKWDKKKTELDEAEKAALQQAQSQSQSDSKVATKQD